MEQMGKALGSWKKKLNNKCFREYNSSDKCIHLFESWVKYVWNTWLFTLQGYRMIYEIINRTDEATAKITKMKHIPNSLLF